MRGVNIQFGCGGNHLEGFQNFDMDCDITKPLPFSNDHADYLYASHVFEHLTVHEGLRFLQECHRVLKPVGIVRLVVPTLGRITDRAHGIDLINGHGHKHLWCEQSLYDVLWAAGFDRRDITATRRCDIDQHWKVIGMEKDNIESCFIEATK